MVEIGPNLFRFLDNMSFVVFVVGIVWAIAWAKRGKKQ